MADVIVTSQDRDTFRVRIEEGSSFTEHTVTIGKGDLERLPQTPTTADLVEASFHFLLDREPKESILGRFELGVINRYFPEYPDRIGDYL